MFKQVYLLLGTNLGDRENYILSAEKAIEGIGIQIVRRSSIVESPAWGKEDQPNFLNRVIEIETSFPPKQLLKELKKIEEQIGRESRERWGPREIDIDILLYGQLEVNEPDLIIPHPSMSERSFTLVPLSELAAEMNVAVLNKSVSELLALRADTDQITIYNA